MSELIGPTLRALGLPSKAASERLRRAWSVVADPVWVQRTAIHRIEGGVLDVAVASSSLRHELSAWHGQRLLAAMREALPEVPLVALRFVESEESS